jgi:phospholipid-binding lipoprotein MlaA
MTAVRFLARVWALSGMMALALALAGCASSSQAGNASQDPQSTIGDGSGILEDEAAEDDNDPLESVNRAVFEFNDAADRFVLRPLAVAYRDVVPDPAQRGIHNALDNLRGPIMFANDLLQGDIDGAGVTLTRFVVNSTVGVLGLFDVADDWGLPRHDQDFGLTFASWGIGNGPYLVLPILGPSNPRDGTGLLAEFFTDPFSIIASNSDADYLNYIRYGLTTLDQRSRVIDDLDTVRNTSLDYYAAIRSLYEQHRGQQIEENAARRHRRSSGGGTTTPGAVGTPSGVPSSETGPIAPAR